VKQIRKRLTYANVMSTLAVFLVLGGATAFAATELAKNSVGTKQLKKNAVTAAKIKKEAVGGGKIKNGAVSTPKIAAGAVTGEKLASGAVAADKIGDNALIASKIADNAVTAGKLADNAVTTGKLANEAVTTGKLANGGVSNAKIGEGAVTANKLTAGERSEAFASSVSSGSQALANGLIGTYGPEQSVSTLTLPAGNFVVTAQSEFINTDVGENHDATCRLVDDGAELAEQSVTALPGLLFPSAGVTAVGISDGGRVDLACRQGATGKVFAFKAQIIALRVGAVTGP
jgi:trimeric autotransporter adhesin